MIVNGLINQLTSLGRPQLGTICPWISDGLLGLGVVILPVSFFRPRMTPVRHLRRRGESKNRVPMNSMVDYDSPLFTNCHFGGYTPTSTFRHLEFEVAQFCHNDQAGCDTGPTSPLRSEVASQNGFGPPECITLVRGSSWCEYWNIDPHGMG